MANNVKVISSCMIAGVPVAKGAQVPEGATPGELQHLAAIGKVVLGDVKSAATPAAKQDKA
jgi:inosine-uridine nucleoside N-ribohydrolase